MQYENVKAERGVETTYLHARFVEFGSHAYGNTPGCFLAISWARAGLLPPTGSFAASASLLHVGFPDLSNWESDRECPFTCMHAHDIVYPTSLFYTCRLSRLFIYVTAR